MAALGQRGHLKLILPSCPKILSGRTRNKLLSPNGNSYSWVESRSCRILYPNRTLSSLPANSFVLQHLGSSSHRLAAFSTCFIPSRNKSSFTSVFLPFVGKNNNKSFRSSLDQILNISSLLSSSHPTLLPSDIQCRFRQKRKNRNKSQEDESFSDDEVDELEDEEFEEETNLPLNYKQLKVNVKSPRADALLSTGLNISRAKIDSMFYASKLLLNDKPLTKKSKNLEEGDCIDLITESSEDIKVKRVKVLNVSSDRGKTDKICVVLRAWRSPFSLSSLEEEK